MVKKIKKEVSDSTHLKRYVTEMVQLYEEDRLEDGDELTSDVRAAMVDNVLDLIGDPVELLFNNAVDNEFDLYLDSDDDDGDGDEESEEEEEEGDDDEAEVIEGEFTEEEEDAA